MNNWLGQLRRSRPSNGITALAVGTIFALTITSPARAQASLAAPYQSQSQGSAALRPQIVASPGDTKQIEAARHLARAKSLFDGNHLRAAQLEYEKSLAARRSPEAYIGLGKIAEKLVGPAAARAQFEEAVKVDPSSIQAHRELGLFCLNNRDLVEANNQLTKVLQMDGGDQEAARNLVSLWQAQLSVANNANSHFGLARAYQLSGSLDLARSEYREVVKLDPNNPALPAARQSFKQAQARQEAEKDLQQAEQLELQGRVNDAYQLVGQAMALSPANNMYKLYQAELLTKLGQPAVARQICTNVLKDEPQNQTAMQMLQLLANYNGPAAPAQCTVLPGSMVPGTNIYMPATVVQQAAVAAPPQRQATNLDATAMPASGINTLSSFLSQLRDKVFDQGEIQGQAQSAVSTTPVADPAGMLHGLGDGSIDGFNPPSAGSAGRLNIGSDTPAGGMGR